MRKSLTKALAFAVALVMALPMSAAPQQIVKAKASASVEALAEMKTKKVAPSARPFMSKQGMSATPLARAQKFMKQTPKANPSITTFAGTTPINGAVIYSDNELFENGMYEIPVSGTPTTLEALLVSDYMNPNGGGVYIDGKYYAFYYLQFWGMLFTDLYVFDTENGWEVIGDYEFDPSCMATDMAYDEASGWVYGSFYNENLDGFEFARINLSDPASIVRETIAPLNAQWNGCAIDKDGTLYAIDAEGNLLKVDKTTGAQTLVGATGVEPAYLASACIDQRTGDLYWLPCPADECSYLYTVDKTTGAGTKLYQIPGNAEIVGAYVPAPKAADGAPAPATNVTANFANGALTGTVEFDMPTTLFDGTAATGSVDYAVNVNGEAVATGSALYGSHVVANVTLPAAGNYKFSVVLRNGEGASPASNVSTWVGPDTPSPVTNVVSTYNDATGAFTITWDPVTTSVNDGYFVPSEVKYDVVMYVGLIEGMTVASGLTETSFTLPMPEPTNGLQIFRFEVVAYFDGLASVPGMSNSLSLGSIVPPFTETFDDEMGFDVFSIIDANNDGRTWFYSNGEARYQYSSSNNGDDWLITPSIRVQAGNVYDITIVAGAYSSYFPERIEAYIGTAPTAEAMTEQIIAPTDLTDNVLKNFTYTYVAEKSGKIYVGIHAISDADQFYLIVDEISIAAGYSAAGPDVVNELTVKPDANGGRSAYLTFWAPSVAINGDELTSLQKIEVYRNGELAKTFNSVAPGKPYNWLDMDCDYGRTTYSVVAYNKEGAGKPSEVSTFIGVNEPSYPTDVVATQTTPGVVKLSWDAPETDCDGYPIAAGLVKYRVYQQIDGAYPMILDEVGTQTVSIEVGVPDSQEFYQFFVAAYTEAGESSATAANLVAVGEPYSVPFAESFANGTISYIFATQSSQSAQMTLFTDSSINGVTAQDGDNGFAGVYAQYADEYASLESGLISLAGAQAPVFSFYYLNLGADCENVIEAYINNELKATYVLNGEAATWSHAVVDLSEYKDQDITFQIFGYIVTNTLACIDNITVGDPLEYDVAVGAVKTEAKVKAGEEFVLGVSVANNGSKAANNVKVDLYRDGEVVGTETIESIEPEASALVAFVDELSVLSNPTVDYYAVATMAGDQNLSNNTSVITTVNVVLPTYPTVEIAGSLSGSNITLTWAEPTLDADAPQWIVEDFASDDYEGFTIENFGAWTLYAGNTGTTYGFQGVDFPNAYGGFGWILFDSGAIGAESNFPDHSGDNRALAAFAHEQGSNDAWVISPVLPGVAQTVSFWAKAQTAQYGPETMKCYYSTTGKELNDFVEVTIAGYDASNGAATEWTQYSFDIPEGAKYFAIQSTATDCFVLWIDDIRYFGTPSATEEVSIVGYNVYRDGVKVNEAPLAETTYTEALPDSNVHTYVVTVVYDKGESAPSNTVSTANLTPSSGVEGVVAKVAKVSVDKNAIIVADAAEFVVVDAAGKLIYSGSNNAVVRVAAGVYMVKAGNNVTKVVVK